MKKSLRFFREGGVKSRCSLLSRLFLVSLFVLFSGMTAWSQSRTITGTVVDAENNPVPGASIVLDGTSRGTSALGDGTFSLANVPASGTLTVSMLGFTDQSVSLTGSNNYSVTLSEDTQFLDEVVVVGYGVMRKSDVTGAMSSVGAEQLQERPVANPLQALQGRAAGVDITNNARPGEVGSIRIRGQRSITASKDPLFVVDGIPLSGDTNLSVINTYDIKSIDILKDASATAIYGSRGANGVVLVTTNRGEAGRFSINYNGSMTVSKLVDSAERYTAGEAIEMLRWGYYYSNPSTYPEGNKPTIEADVAMFGKDEYAFANLLNGWSNGAAGGVWDGSKVPTTDWGGMVTRTGIIHNHSLSASGGTDRMTSRASFGYYNEKGTSLRQGLERYTLNVASVIKPKSWFELSLSMNTTWAIQEYGQSGAGTVGSASGPRSIYAAAMRLHPYAVPYDTDGNRILMPGGEDSLRSVVDEEKHSQNRRETFNAFASLSAKVYLPIEGLTYEFRTGPSFRQRRNGQFVTPLSSERNSMVNMVRLDNNRQFSWTLDNQVDYNRTFGKHSIAVTLLQTAEKYQRVEDNINAENQPVESAKWHNMGTTDVATWRVGSNLIEQQMTSYMIRPQYTFNDKFILTGTIRWDGSSVLAPGHKWGTFYSVAGAWRLEQEEFIKNISWIQQLKFRLGYGESGSAGVGPYSTLGNISSALYSYGSAVERFYYINNQRPEPGNGGNKLPDLGLGWEVTRTMNVGLDFSLFRSRVSGSLDYFHSITSDLLLDSSIPAETGYVITTSNLGKTQNNGVELALNTINVRAGDFTWESSLNLAWQKDKILELSNGKVDEIANSRFIGYPIRVFYNYESAGIWREEDSDLMNAYNSNKHPVTGEAKTAHDFRVGQVRPVDQDGDYVIDINKDRVVIGQRDPAWTGGIQNTFSYKGVELSIMMYGRLGYWADGANVAMGGRGMPRKVDYYSETNKTAAYQRPFKTTDGGENDRFAGILAYEKVSFVNVRNIMLGYVFPRALVQKWGMQNLRVYAQVENPFAVYQSRKWQNMDLSSEIWNRNFVFGLNIGF